ncbi:MAG: hypothetical protein I8H87_05235 [Comamonadaceae bacterium]|nr:hypothetical protein [Comamonadaceae bacterium]
MALTTLERTNITKLVVAMFNAAPGADYLAEFATAYEANGGGLSTLSALAQGLANTSAYKALNPDSQTAEEFAAEFLTPLGLQANAEALKFVVDKVKAGENKGQIAFEAALAINDYTGDNAELIAAQAILINKTTVAEYYSVTMEVHQTSLVALQQVISTVTKDAASVTAAEAAIDNGAGTTVSTLTPGVDAFIGTTGNDIINALPVDSTTGASASTLNAFDSIEGGAGNDTLNIYTTSGFTPRNSVFPANATVKNVETINIFNAGSAPAVSLGDASHYAGATAINQIGINAVRVTNLAAGTTAGFSGTTSPIRVTAAAAASTAAVALTKVTAATLTVDAAAGGVLNSVTVSGDATPFALSVTAGKNVEALSINTAINVTTLIVVGNEAGSAKLLSTVDASASAGDIFYFAAPAVANIKTGAGTDTVTLNTAFSATVKTASVSTGAGNDVITVSTSGAAGTVSIDAGAGNDTINVTKVAGNILSILGGAGDDVITFSGALEASDVIDGGDGVDTVVVAGAAARVAGDFIIVNNVLKNFETLKFSSAEGAVLTALDASQLGANYTTIDFTGSSFVKNVGTQALVAHGDLTASAVGYVLGATPALTTYAGTLNITEKAVGTITASADVLNLTVKAGTSDINAILRGDLHTANVTLTNSVNAGATADTFASVNVNTSVSDFALTSLTLSGNGSAVVFNGAAGKLTSVDASTLGGTFTLGANAGSATNGLYYGSGNTAAETIKLGAGLDHIILEASTYGKADTVTGLNLVLNAATAIDTAKSDTIKVTGFTGGVKFTTTQTNLDLALLDAAHSTNDNLVFQLGGDTYIYHDAGTLEQVDAADTVVHLVGAVNLDALIVALA